MKENIDNEVIDSAILAVVQPRWRKVAFIVVKAAEKLQNLPDGDAGYRCVAKRIEALVSECRLEAQGDLSKWRFSEIRLPLSSFK